MLGVEQLYDQPLRGERRPHDHEADLSWFREDQADPRVVRVGAPVARRGTGRVVGPRTGGAVGGLAAGARSA
ncbi:hypothetical protein GCM10017772_23820 [Promicromonospora soli]|uniref:Uncharacterized protein n=1 Tax=Promicromonospora soli TaxID=2035533 RepID=A0A919KUR0_9MICO|nr:hypothetical protein GCM10017772_23820 [Promicromonospora soli]